MPNFKTSAHPTGDILIDETISNSSQNFRLDNVDYKFYVFLVNGDGQIFGIANDSIELLQITDNILEIAALSPAPANAAQRLKKTPPMPRI